MSYAFTPLRFHNGTRELFALHVHPQGTRRNHAVLLCNPFGQEYIRAHRLYRVLGDRLAAAGFDVLRFDYYGSGDSGGDDAEWDINGAVVDTWAAASVLLQHSRAQQFSLAGLRLGANIAALASERCARRPRVLAMIEPVISGTDYLNALRKSHERALARAFGVRWPLDPALRALNMPDAESEALGFALTPESRSQLRNIELSRNWPGRCEALLVLAHDPAALHAMPGLRDRSNWPTVDFVKTEIDMDWATNSAINTAIVPVQWVAQLVKALEDSPNA